MKNHLIINLNKTKKMKQQHEWFEALSKKRNNTATTLMEDFAIGNMWNSVVEKYSDEAHFIYELIQNANDVDATAVCFSLTKDGLFFTHNGTRHFWVSDPQNERVDQENNQLGDLNAITAVAQSNKKDHSTIGKFGVGFKAVFQYTNTPYIYDPNFKFKIENYIVPIKLDSEISSSNPDETVFYFPFNKAGISKTNAYESILNKLRKLIYPTLFLTKLNKIDWEADNGENGQYYKEVTEEIEKGNIKYEKVSLNQDKYIVFQRVIDDSGLMFSIGYKLRDNNLTSSKFDAFCFFPTKETTNLNFIVHAPFLLTDSRERIHRSKEHNFTMIKLLADLAADSLLILRNLKMINDKIIEIIPFEEPEDDDLFAPFYFTLKEKFQKEKILPAKSGYINSDNAYWAQDKSVLDLFSDEQLAYLTENNKAKWVFRNFVRNQTDAGSSLRTYIEDCISNWFNMRDMLDLMDTNFIQNQSNEWLKAFYEFLSKNNSYWEEIYTKPIFLNQDGNAVPAFNDNDELILFFPDGSQGFEQLNSALFKEVGKKIFQKLGIRTHTVTDEIEEAITEFETNHLNPDSFFAKSFNYFKNECPQNEINDFIEKIKDLPFIPFYNLNEKGYDSGEHLFYPTKKINEFYKNQKEIKFVDLEKLVNSFSEDKRILKKFLVKLGVNADEPGLKDEVFNIIIPNLEEIVVEKYEYQFSTLFNYYRKCENEELEDFIDELMSLEFIKFKTNEDEIGFEIPDKTYYPTPDLEDYFETKPSTKFIDWDYYLTLINDEKVADLLKEFLLKVGVNTLPIQTTHRVKPNDVFELDNRDLLVRKSYNVLDGCAEILNEIYQNDNKEKSILLWKMLYLIGEPLKEIYSRIKIDYWSEIENFELQKLKNTSWLVSKDDEFVEPTEISIKDLHSSYTKNYLLEELLNFDEPEFQNIHEKIEDFIEKKYEGDEDAFDEEFEEFIEWKKQRDEEKNERESEVIQLPQSGQKLSINTENGLNWLKDIAKTVTVGEHKRSKPSNSGLNVEQKDKDTVTVVGKPSANSRLNDFEEEKEFTDAVEIVSKKIEIQNKRNQLFDEIEGADKYSYDWFIAYLELLNTFYEKEDSTKQKSISFQKIKAYSTDNKYFLLCGASGYISPEIEDADDFKITFTYKDNSKENREVEGVSKRGQDLLIYFRDGISQKTLSKISNVFKIEIKFSPVIDLLQRLYKAFKNKENIISWNDIKESLPTVDYIYGPPGTGKTTTLCDQINNILKIKANSKILVLTPTNKAADVVCEKLNNVNSRIFSIRLSKPTDFDLEEDLGLYRDGIGKEDMKAINVVASTIHRLSYFEIQEIGLLFQYKWDYVIFEEASMIGLHYITFAIMSLYKTSIHTKFVISGDPKQIPPVIEIDDKEIGNFDFQDENIYKMMGLDNFKPRENMIRRDDKINYLETQYRSIPQIGQIFSHLSYSNKLKHERNDTGIKKLPEKIKNLFSNNVSFIDIPLDKEHSIYKVSRLNYSSYQIYCSILIAEIIKYFDNSNTGEKWTIGIIAPYKAQAILLNKLITSYGISENIRVIADTVHGFQGDECDIVFFVCNPNNYKYTGDKRSLLSKEYIYNVAISRARDYLIVLHPFSKIKNNEFINSILNYSENEKILSSKEIENEIFGDTNFIEKNSYVSGHDNINIFGLTEMKYFIKVNETAIDIQLRDIKNETINELNKEEEFIKTESPKLKGVKVLGNVDLSKFEKYKRK